MIGKILGSQRIGPEVFMYNMVPLTDPFAHNVLKELDNKDVNPGVTISEQFDEIDRENAYLCIVVMQKLDGMPYADYTRKIGKLSAEQNSILCGKIQNMHKLGILHNDLHEWNIFIHKDEPYIIDFGLSQIIDEKQAEANRQKGNWLGFLTGIDREDFHTLTFKNEYASGGPFETRPGPELTSRKQYCTKAGWPCERSLNKPIFQKCLMESKNEDEKINVIDSIKNSETSGFVGELDF